VAPSLLMPKIAHTHEALSTHPLRVYYINYKLLNSIKILTAADSTDVGLPTE